MQIRKASFAGSWYPDQTSDCEAQIRDFLDHDSDPQLVQAQWDGGIVPHAGWFFSGSIACHVINYLQDDAPPDLVVIFGMHLHSESSNYMMPKGAWQTPFGPLPVAEDLAHALQQQFTFKLESPTHFTPDNTIELQLPFVKYLLNPPHILALGVPPRQSSLKIAKAIVDWAQTNHQRIKIIGSTDLTHYGRNYGFAPKGIGKAAVQWVRNQNDRRIIDTMLTMDPQSVIQEALQNQNACCAGAAAAAIAATKHKGATQAKTVAYATSFEKSPSDSFVGYTGIVMGA